MQISRRGFLGGLIASATMAEAGAIAELFAWLRRKPKSFTAPAGGWPLMSSPELLQDSAFNIERYLQTSFARQLVIMHPDELKRLQSLTDEHGNRLWTIAEARHRRYPFRKSLLTTTVMFVR
jgi:hypothetical protein